MSRWPLLGSVLALGIAAAWAQNAEPVRVVVPEYHRPSNVPDGTYRMNLVVEPSGDVSKVTLASGPADVGTKLVFDRLIAPYIVLWKYRPAQGRRTFSLRLTYELLPGDGPRKLIIFDGPNEVLIRLYHPVVGFGDYGIPRLILPPR